MKEKHHRILDHSILGYFLLMLFSMIVAELVSFIIDDMILAGVIPGYAVTQNILGEERVQASGVGDAVGAVLAIALFTLGFVRLLMEC